jgi:hypothetical protein
VFTRFITGDRTMADAEQLDRLLRAIVVAVSLDHADDAPGCAAAIPKQCPSWKCTLLTVSEADKRDGGERPS